MCSASNVYVNVYVIDTINHRVQVSIGHDTGHCVAMDYWTHPKATKKQYLFQDVARWHLLHAGAQSVSKRLHFLKEQ